MSATPKVGDRAYLYHEGSMPCPATVTAVEDGKITEVRPGGSWMAFHPDDFRVEGWEPGDWTGHVILYDHQVQP